MSLDFNLFHDEAFENVAFLDVVVLLDGHAAFIVGSYLLDGVLKALQAGQLALVDDDIVPEDA